MKPDRARVLGLAMYYLGLVEGGRKYVQIKDFAEMVAPELKAELLACVADILHLQIGAHTEQNSTTYLTAEERADVFASLAADINRFTGHRNSHKK